MSTKLKIKVTKDILKESSNCNADTYQKVGHNCAIALAVRQIFPNAWVDSKVIIPFTRGLEYEGVVQAIREPDISNYISLPEEAVEFIDEFDESTPEARLDMDEIEFEVEIPDAVVDQLDISEIGTQLLNHPTLTLSHV